jgi:hypothetical protein
MAERLQAARVRRRRMAAISLQLSAPRRRRRPTLLSAHRALCTVLSFHPTLPWLVSGGDGAAIFIWRPYEAIAPLGMGRMVDTATSLAWFRTMRLIVAADASGLVRAFRVPRGLPQG